MLNLSTETLLILVSFAVNLVVVAMLVIHMLKDGKVQASAAPPVDEENLKALVAHLEDLVVECDRVSRDLCEQLSSKEEICKDLLRRLDLKKETIIAQYAGLGGRVSLERTQSLFEEETQIDDTARVRILSDTGLGPADIAQRLQLPLGEVKLMLSLQRQ